MRQQTLRISSVSRLTEFYLVSAAAFAYMLTAVVVLLPRLIEFDRGAKWLFAAIVVPPCALYVGAYYTYHLLIAKGVVPFAVLEFESVGLTVSSWIGRYVKRFRRTTFLSSPSIRVVEQRGMVTLASIAITSIVLSDGDRHLELRTYGDAREMILQLAEL